MSDDAKQTPLLDLLRAVPADACCSYEHSPTEHQHIPVGRLCAEAADALEAKEREIARLRAENASLHGSLNAATDPIFDPQKLPSVTELEDILNSTEPSVVRVLPNGEIRAEPINEAEAMALVLSHEGTIDRLRAEIESLKRDAERMRTEIASVLRYCRDTQASGTANERAVAQVVARMFASPPSDAALSQQERA